MTSEHSSVRAVRFPAAYDFPGTESPFRPFWALRPTTAFAWTLEGFPRGATRWRFANRSNG
jgi:hypothetical protein